VSVYLRKNVSGQI